jgi:excisionase family DNA binding protein
MSENQTLPATQVADKRVTSSSSDNREPLAISVDEAAALAGVSRSLLYDEMVAGRLAWAKIGKRRVIPIAALRSWLDAATTNGGGNSDR